MLITRYGNPGGHFAAPDGVLWTERAMPLGSNVNLHKYKVLKDITVQEGLASPWFDQAGCGVQFQFSDSLKDLLDQNALVEIFDTKQQ
jgi:hypothetical protein